MGQLSEGHMYPACTEFLPQEIILEIMNLGTYRGQLAFTPPPLWRENELWFEM